MAEAGKTWKHNDMQIICLALFNFAGKRRNKRHFIIVLYSKIAIMFTLLLLIPKQIR